MMKILVVQQNALIPFLMMVAVAVIGATLVEKMKKAEAAEAVQIQAVYGPIR